MRVKHQSFNLLKSAVFLSLFGIYALKKYVKTMNGVYVKLSTDSSVPFTFLFIECNSGR
jgi:hypothetical protein